MGSDLGVKTVCAGLKGKYEAAELADRRYKFSTKVLSLVALYSTYTKIQHTHISSSLHSGFIQHIY